MRSFTRFHPKKWLRIIFDHGAERRQSPPFTSFIQASLVVGWQNKHDEGKEGTRIVSDPPGNLLQGQCGLKRWPAKPLTEFQNPNQLGGGAGELVKPFWVSMTLKKWEKKRKRGKKRRKKKSEKREGKEGFRSIREFINYSKYLYYVGSRRVLSDLLDFNGVVRNEDRIIGT